MSAADALESGGDEGPEEMESDSEDSSEGSLFIPSDMLGDHECQAGDMITMKVLGKDKDGDVEVKIEGYEKGEPESFADGMRKHMAQGGEEY